MGYEVRYALVVPDNIFSRVISVFDMGKIPYHLGQPKGEKVFNLPWYFPGTESPVTKDRYGDPILGFSVDAMKEWISAIDPEELGYFAALNRESILAAIKRIEDTGENKNDYIFLKYGY